MLRMYYRVTPWTVSYEDMKKEFDELDEKFQTIIGSFTGPNSEMNENS